MENIDFEDIRPFNDLEVPDAIKRISENIFFPEVVKYIFPDVDIRSFTQQFKQIQTVDDFQVEIMYKVIPAILKHTTNMFLHSGADKLTNDINYMFVSNHRDIMMDSAILQIVLHESGIKTSEITFGSNLMKGQFVIDIGKINKMFKIVRGGTIREIFTNSLRVSQYMRYAITQKKESIWIAQRNGRTKNGNDVTDDAVLKMFAMSSKEPFAKNMAELNITPVSISYEYEPCDFLKTREIYISRRREYVKESEEDFLSILHGIKQWKENINLTICNTITKEELEYCDTFNNKDKFKELALIMDKRIYANYKLWKTNYIAHDMLNNSNTFSSYYQKNDKDIFVDYMMEGLKNIDGVIEELKEIFLSIYAYPIKNCFSLQSEK